MHALTLQKVGNAMYLHLSKDAVDALRIGEGDVVYLTRTANRGYRITPQDSEFARRMKFALAGAGGGEVVPR